MTKEKSVIDITDPRAGIAPWYQGAPRYRRTCDYEVLNVEERPDGSKIVKAQDEGIAQPLPFEITIPAGSDVDAENRFLLEGGKLFRVIGLGNCALTSCESGPDFLDDELNGYVSPNYKTGPKVGAPDRPNGTSQ